MIRPLEAEQKKSERTLNENEVVRGWSMRRDESVADNVFSII